MITTVVAQNVGAWSLYDISEMEEVIDQMLEVNGGEATEILKKAFLHEHINELSVKGFLMKQNSIEKSWMN